MSEGEDLEEWHMLTLISSPAKPSTTNRSPRCLGVHVQLRRSRFTVRLPQPKTRNPIL